MIRTAAVVGIVYGLVSLVGGVQGYLSKGSTASLIAGGAAGVLLVAAGALALTGRSWPLWILGIVAVALVGRFAPAFLKNTSNVWPALVMAALGAVSAVVTTLALFGGKPSE